MELWPSNLHPAPTSLAAKLALGKGLSNPGTDAQGRGESPCPKGLEIHLAVAFPSLTGPVILGIEASCLGWTVMLSVHMAELNLSLPLTDFILGLFNHLS